MTLGLSDFLSDVTTNPALLIVSILTLAVLLVNGWTDAPNAIATCVSTRSLAPRTAIAMAAVCNFLGVFALSAVNANVANTIYNMVDFGADTATALTALCAAMVAIVLWAAAAWKFGIPTSESHALIAGISGAAIAARGSLEGINGGEWIKVLYGLGLSTLLGFGAGFLISRLVALLGRRTERAKAQSFFRRAQIGGAAAMAFLHGAQDGQKFMGLFLLGAFLARGIPGESFGLPVWLMAGCSVVMALGTSIGGMRIIKTVGRDMVRLDGYQGFSADLAAAACLLLCSLTGLPVSTTHTKSTAIMGAAAAKRAKSVRWSVARELFVAWVLTFPGCGLLSFAFVKLFLLWS